MSGNPKLIVIELLKEVDNGKYSNIILSDFFSKNNIPVSEKGFITELFYGVLRNKILVDYLIVKYVNKIKKKDLYYLFEISLYQEMYMKSDSAGIVWEACEITKKRFGNGLVSFVNGVLRALFRGYKEELEKLRAAEKYDILYSYEKWQFEKLKSIYGEETAAVMESYKTTPYLSVRVNRLKYSCQEFEEYLSIKGINILSKVENVYYIDSGEVIKDSIFRDGKIIAQDGASYLAAALLKPDEGDVILDCCAAPGTKTTLIGELVNNKGKIVALDLYPHKIKLIEENCLKTGVNIVESSVCDARTAIEKYQHVLFDKILADVPCSGFGVIRKKPEVVYTKQKSDINGLVKIQREILLSVTKLLKKGGEMVYSTCTIFNEENTDNIEWFLNTNKNFAAVDIVLPDGIDTEKDRFGGIKITYKNRYLDGFYIIKLKRVE